MRYVTGDRRPECRTNRNQRWKSWFGRQTSGSGVRARWKETHLPRWQLVSIGGNIYRRPAGVVANDAVAEVIVKVKLNKITVSLIKYTEKGFR